MDIVYTKRGLCENLNPSLLAQTHASGTANCDSEYGSLHA